MPPSTRPAGKASVRSTNIAHRPTLLDWWLRSGGWEPWLGAGHIFADGRPFLSFPSFPTQYLIDRRDLPSPTVPVGVPSIQPVPEISRDELSDLVIAESPPAPAPSAIPDPLTVSIDDAGGIAFDWFDYWEKTRAGVFVLPPVDTTTSPAAQADDFLLTPVSDIGGDDVVSFFDDLGDIIIDLIPAYVNPPGPSVPYQPPSFVDPTLGPGPAPMPPGPGGGSCAPGDGPKPVWKCVCGVYKWVYPKRRRRRQLLTESDYNGLLRIESLKVNKNMTVAIAKALTR